MSRIGGKPCVSPRPSYSTLAFDPPLSLVTYVLNPGLSNKARNPLSGVLNKSTLEISLSVVMAAEMVQRPKAVKRHLIRFSKTGFFGRTQSAEKCGGVLGLGSFVYPILKCLRRISNMATL